jgi:anti-sigma factor RsiW
MKCAEIRELLPAHAGERDASLALRRHLSTCPDCREELARYEALLGALGSLATATAEPPAGLASALSAIPAQETPLRSLAGHLARNRRAYVGGTAMALAGAAAGAVLWRNKSRRLATA